MIIDNMSSAPKILIWQDLAHHHPWNGHMVDELCRLSSDPV